MSNRIIEPGQYIPPCGHVTCSDRATYAGCYCADHWWMLPEYMRAAVLLGADRHECLIAKGRPAEKAMLERCRAVLAAARWLNGLDARALPADYQRPA